MHKNQIKQTFEGFADVNEISKSEEERFKQLVDEMDDLEEGTVTAPEEVIHLIGELRDKIKEDLEDGEDLDIAVVANCNQLAQELRPEEFHNRLREMEKEEAREVLEDKGNGSGC